MALLRRWRLSLAAGLTLIAILAEQSGAQNPYVDIPKDPKAQKIARDSRKDLCSEGFIGADELADSRVDRKEGLERAVGGDNIVKQILEKSKSQSGLQTTAQEELSIPWLISKAGPLIFMFIVLFSWSICCWTLCCKRCRCGKKERSCPKLCKLPFLIVVAGIGFILLILASVAYAGYQSMVTGFDNMACTSAKLMDNTLSGTTSPPFIGMIPMLEEFYTLNTKLDTTSPFMVEVGAVIDSTKTIDGAVKSASATVGLLKDMMVNAANLNPKSSTGIDLQHECKFCAGMAPQLTSVKSALDNGVATALQAARQSVRDQLTSPAASQELKGTFTTASKPLKEVKRLIRDLFTDILVGDTFGMLRELMVGAAFQAAVAFILIWALALGGCGLSAAAFFLVCEKSSSKLKDNASAEKATTMQNPYNKAVPRLSACTWCCGCGLVMFACFIGGLFTMFSVPLAGICLVLDELNLENLNKMSPALGMNNSGDSGPNMMMDMIDKCFVSKGNSNLLDILTIPNAAGGRSTVRNEIVEEVKGVITKKFDDMNTKMASGAAPLAGGAGIVALRKTLRDNKVDEMILPTAALVSDARFSGLASSSNNVLKAFSTTSASCVGQATASADFPSTVAFQGLNGFDTALASIALTSVAAGDACAKTVTCSPAATECNAGRQYIDVKQTLRSKGLTAAKYRCDLFKDPNFPADSTKTCDTKNPLKDCVTKTDGTVVASAAWPIDCTLAQFVTYVGDFDTRIDNVMKNVDAAQVANQLKIKSIKTIVDTHIIAGIDKVADGATCGFLGKTFRELIDGFCYQGVWGFDRIASSYVASAIFTLILIAVMYGLWRVSADNISQWKQSDESSGPGLEYVIK